MNRWKQLLWYHDVSEGLVWADLRPRMWEWEDTEEADSLSALTSWIGILWRNFMSFWFSLWINLSLWGPCPWCLSQGVHLLNSLVVLLPSTWLQLATCHQLRIPGYKLDRNLSPLTGPQSWPACRSIVFTLCTPTRPPLKSIPPPSPYAASKPHKQRVITHDAEQMGSSTALLLPPFPPTEITKTSLHICHEGPSWISAGIL